jgi:DNA mismatch repair protein MSH4
VDGFILPELTDQIREELGLLTLLSESVSVLDMIVNSFAHLITIQPPDSYSRPEFTGKL